MERDYRIDFFRGAALLLLLWAHLLAFSGLDSPWFRLTPGFWGFSDASELFVFLAGYVTGAVYWTTYANQGWWLCQAGTLHRAAQLYLANVFTFCVTMGIVAWMHMQLGTDFGHLEAAFRDPAAVFPHVINLTYIPYGFSILPLYMVLLAAAPAMLALMHRRPAIAMLIAITFYAAAQWSDNFNLPRYEGWHGRWTFNPFGWQLVFFIGMTLGMRRRQGLPGVPYRRWAAWACFAVVAIAPALRVLLVLSNRDVLGLGAYQDMLRIVTFPYAGMAKVNQDPLRLVHFLALVYLAAHFIPAHLTVWRSALARPVVVCGQHSLEVYCTHIFFLYASGHVLETTRGGAPALIAAFAVSALGLIAAAYAARWKNRAPWRASRKPEIG